MGQEASLIMFALVTRVLIYKPRISFIARAVGRHCVRCCVGDDWLAGDMSSWRLSYCTLGGCFSLCILSDLFVGDVSSVQVWVWGAGERWVEAEVGG